MCNVNSDPDSVRVWFVCSSCGAKFRKINKFIEHKRTEHFVDYQNLKCIVFDERPLDQVSNDGILNSPSATILERGTTTRGDIGNKNSNANIINSLLRGNQDASLSTINETADMFIPDVIVKEESTFDYEIENHGNLHSHNNTCSPDDFDPFANIKCEMDEFEIENKNETDHHEEFNSALNNYNHALKTDEDWIHSSDQEGPGPSRSTSIPISSAPNYLTSVDSAVSIIKEGIFESESDEDDEDEDESEPVTLSDWLKNQNQKRPKNSKPKPKSNSVSNSYSLSAHDFLNLKKPTTTNFQNVVMTCQLCLKQFSSDMDLKLHLSVHKTKSDADAALDADPLPFKCPFTNCQKAFRRKVNLRDHLQGTHSDLRPYNCPHPDCGKAFKNKKGVNKHMSVHSSERPYKCTQGNCEAAFTRSYHLGEHVKRVHWKLQLKEHIQGAIINSQNQNQIEPSAYSTSSNHTDSEIIEQLKKYERKRFPCDLCDKAFVLKSDLQRHSSVHSMERPFTCPVGACLASFKNKYVLNRHVKEVHETAVVVKGRSNTSAETVTS